MYTENELKKIIEENNFKTIICNSFDESCLIIVPKFEEYKHLFGGGKTKTCYAYDLKHWNDYHNGNSMEIDFLSTSENIDKRFSYITFCVSNIKVEEFVEHKKVSGVICIHDFNHNSYPIMNFESQCWINCDGRVITEKYPSINIDYYVIDSVFNNLVCLREFEKKNILKNVIDNVCLNYIK